MKQEMKQEEEYFDKLEAELKSENMQVYKDLGIELRRAIVFGFEKGSQSKEKEMLNDIKLARQCMEFKLIKCDNKDCKNICCPLQKLKGDENEH